MTYGYEAPATAKVDEMLDGGASGLQYFQEMLPLYRRVRTEVQLGTVELPEYSLLVERYNAERGMDLPRLQTISDAVAAANSVAGTELEAQQRVQGLLPGVWPRGQAGTEVAAVLRQQLDRAAGDRATVTGIENALKAAIGALRGYVSGKAWVVSILWHPTRPNLDGRLTKDIVSVIDLARDWVRDGRPEDEYAQLAYEWLRDSFVPHVVQTTQEFVALCDRTEGDIRRTYGVLAGELNKLSDAPYQLPPDQPVTDQPRPQPNSNQPNGPGPGPSNPATTPAATTPAATTPSTVQTPTTPAATTPAPATTPSVDGLAALNQAAKQLSPLATGLNTALTQGLTALSGVVKESLDKSLDKLREAVDPKNSEPNGDNRSGDGKGKSTAEFDIAGKHVKVELGPDGQPKVVVSGADGKAQEYQLKIDEHGRPVIVTNEPGDSKPGGENKSGGENKPGEAPKSDSRPSGQPAPEKAGAPEPQRPVTPAPEQPSGPGIPTRTPPATPREEDREHTPKIPSGQPRQPDTGAQLAEAGPL